MTLVRALRVQQWPKNLLVFVPLVAAHRVGDSTAVLASAIAFLAFCLVASAIYVANDLIDLEADRLHPKKRLRPFAARELSVSWGMVLCPVLLAAGIGVATLAGTGLTAIVAGYALVGALYSAVLKRVVVVDIFVIAAFYSARILGGAAAIDVVVSDWLFAFSMFIFVSLALAKRYAELRRVAAGQGDGARRLPGRGYRAEDALGVGILGTVSGCLSVVVLAFYITSGEVTVLYSQPKVLWICAFLVFYWVARAWLLAFRGDLDEDPLSFALHDPASYLVGALTLAVVFLAT